MGCGRVGGIEGGVGKGGGVDLHPFYTAVSLRCIFSRRCRPRLDATRQMH